MDTLYEFRPEENIPTYTALSGLAVGLGGAGVLDTSYEHERRRTAYVYIRRPVQVTNRNRDLMTTSTRKEDTYEIDRSI